MEISSLKQQSSLNSSNHFSEDKKGNLFENCDIKCIQRQKGQFYCIQCNEHPVICGNQQCGCFKKHSQCEYFQKISTLHNLLNSKLIPKNNLSEITKITNKLIDQISNLEEEIQNQYKFFGLSSSQQKIAKFILNSDKIQQLKGSYFKDFKANRQKTQNWFAVSSSRFKQIIDRKTHKILQFLSKIERSIREEHIKHLQKNLVWKNQSQILKNSRELKDFESFFSENQTFSFLTSLNYEKRMTQANLIELMQVCNKKSNLIFLIETLQGQKIGGYTKCQFNKDQNNWKRDNKGQSFIFCIDNSFKFNLRGDSDNFKVKKESEKHQIYFKSQNINQSIITQLIIDLSGYCLIDFQIALNESNAKNKHTIKKIQVYQLMENKKQNPKETLIQSVNNQPQKKQNKKQITLSQSLILQPIKETTKQLNLPQNPGRQLNTNRQNQNKTTQNQIFKYPPTNIFSQKNNPFSSSPHLNLIGQAPNQPKLINSLQNSSKNIFELVDSPKKNHQMSIFGNPNVARNSNNIFSTNSIDSSKLFKK